MKDITITRLCDYPQFAAICMQWDDTVWPRNPEIETFFSEHYTAAASTQDEIPQVWIALKDGTIPIGMISLIQDDHPEYTHFSPWLASAYIVPEYRGKGIFRALHNRLVDFVQHNLKLPQLYVYSHVDFSLLDNWVAIHDIQDPFDPDAQVTMFRLDMAVTDRINEIK